MKIIPKYQEGNILAQVHRMRQFTFPGRVEVKNDPSYKDYEPHLWYLENPTKEGYRNGRYFPYSTEVKYSSDPKFDKYRKISETENDIGAGINFEELQLIPKYKSLVKKAKTEGLTQQEIDELQKEKFYTNLSKANEALKLYGTNRPDTISPDRKLNLIDIRYQTGNLGKFQKLLKATGKGDIKAMRRESRTITSKGPDIRRWNYRKENFLK